MIDYRIKSVERFAGRIGELASMLDHTRAVTLEEVKDLNDYELDYLVDEGSNTIGSLLLHIASIEFVHQIISFENRDLHKEELKKWQTALELGSKARTQIRKNGVEYYLYELAQVREQTLRTFEHFTEEWLFEERVWDNGTPYNNYYLWFHVLEDEINHRGQIRAIKRWIAANHK
ncbi:DinB family protein [Halobacillus salinarum]|uniref:DinB family protein n=1 Tax=Halobacillus salinarum TaxID=2932257 RepID=A0ABY4EMW7_9BACI|nr:DinB family protein [Halobacillus salinarum]UOQ45478.1 DinB family protein [Halobacillus salinarum]